MIVEDDDDEFAGAEVVLELEHAGHRRAGGVAGEDALLAGDPARHQRRVLVGDFLEMIDDVEVDVLREEVFADPLGDVRVDLVLVEHARLFVLLEHRSVRVDAPHLDLRVALFQIAPHPGHRPAGADADDEVIDLPLGLLPDFRPRLLVVRLRVRQVVVLVGLPRVRHFALEP